YRQQVQLARSHTIQSHMQRMINMHVRKTVRAHKLTQGFARRAFPGPLSQACEAYDPDYAVTVRDRPRSKSAESRSFQGFLDGRVDLKKFRAFAHRVLHLPLPFLLPVLRPWQVDAVLISQFVMSCFRLQ